MKRIVWLCIFAFLLVACNSQEKDEYAEFEMINTKDPLDERALIEHVMAEQRELLKPGFINEQSNWENGFELNFQQTSFNQKTEELTHSVAYIHTPSDTYFPLLVEMNTEHDRYAEVTEQLKDAQPLQERDGYYGYIEEDGEKYYQYIAKENGATYYFENNTDPEDRLNADLVSMIGDSLKKEEDGAYSYFYDRFEFKLDDLHFPQMNQEYVENVEIDIVDVGHWAFDNSNFIKITYDLGDNTLLHFYNYGMDLYTPNVSYTEIKEEETDGGQTVTTFDTDIEYRTVYLWEADEHYYVIELDMKNEAISTEEIYAVIDSSRDDTRSFSDKDVFKSINEGPSHNELDEEILQNLLDMAN